MKSNKPEQQRAREQYAALASHYQAIGPADLLAAVMAMQSARKREEERRLAPRAA